MSFDQLMFDEDVLFTYIGYAAGLATILTFTIQILKIIETKKVTNLSSYMYIIYTLGLVCWFAYGIYIDNMILIISNLVTFFFTFVILLLIIYYDAEDKIERERRDELTSVYNRKYFEQTIPIRIAEAKTLKQDYTVLMVSTDNYKETVESHGIKAANKILKDIAKFLDKDLRENDMVARYEGDQFVIYLSNADDKSAKLVADRLYNNAGAIVTKITKAISIPAEIKIGVCSSKNGSDMEDLIQKADKSLKEITPASKSKVKIYKKG